MQVLCTNLLPLPHQTQAVAFVMPFSIAAFAQYQGAGQTSQDHAGCWLLGQDACSPHEVCCGVQDSYLYHLPASYTDGAPLLLEIWWGNMMSQPFLLPAAVPHGNAAELAFKDTACLRGLSSFTDSLSNLPPSLVSCPGPGNYVIASPHVSNNRDALQLSGPNLVCIRAYICDHIALKVTCAVNGSEVLLHDAGES